LQLKTLQLESHNLSATAKTLQFWDVSVSESKPLTCDDTTCAADTKCVTGKRELQTVSVCEPNDDEDGENVLKGNPTCTDVRCGGTGAGRRCCKNPSRWCFVLASQFFVALIIDFVLRLCARIAFFCLFFRSQIDLSHIFYICL
jgi:hypothetical protein